MKVMLQFQTLQLFARLALNTNTYRHICRHCSCIHFTQKESLKINIGCMHMLLGVFDVHIYYNFCTLIDSKLTYQRYSIDIFNLYQTYLSHIPTYIHTLCMYICTNPTASWPTIYQVIRIGNKSSRIVGYPPIQCTNLLRYGHLFSPFPILSCGKYQVFQHTMSMFIQPLWPLYVWLG